MAADSPVSAASPLIVMGVNDSRQCLEGWHVREHDGRNGVCYRWTALQAAFRLALPEGARCVRLMAAAPVALTGRPLSLSLYVRGKLLAHLDEAVRTEFWTIVEAPLGALCPPGETDFALRCERRRIEAGRELFEPDAFVADRYLHNGDHRRMGLMVAWIRAA